jgi:signal transduction histidine kinase
VRTPLNLSKLRFKWKVFAYLLSFCAVLLVVLWLFQTVLLNDTYQFIRKQELRKVIAMVEKDLENYDLQTIIFRAQRESDIMIAPTPEFVPPGWMSPEPGGDPGKPPLHAIAETREFVLKNGRTISLTFYALLAPVSATVATLRLQLAIITAIMLIFSILLAMILAKRVSKPIETITESAFSLAKGDYGTRFSGKGFYEIVTLSDALNTTAIELGKAESLRRELLANVSHDLRTPLSLIYSYAEMMHDFPTEMTPEHAQVIMSETKRLTELVNDVLDLSKLEANLELKISSFNLTTKIVTIIERMGELLKREGFVIDFSHDSEATVAADEGMIGQVFYNLLVNAVNYSGECRLIKVEQTLHDGRVRISVIDGGEGVAPDDLPFIWDRYYKSSKKHTRAVTGTGLGLSIVKKILDLHGCPYGVHSEVGKGSTFWFELNV